MAKCRRRRRARARRRTFVSPVGPGRGVSAADRHSLRRIIAAEVRGLANLRQRVVQRLARLALQQGDQRASLRLDGVGGAQQDFRALRDRRCAPGGEGRLRRGHGVEAPLRRRAPDSGRQRRRAGFRLPPAAPSAPCGRRIRRHANFSAARKDRPAGEAGVARPAADAKRVQRIGQQVAFGRRGIGGAGDEGTVGAVFDQPPHQIGEQVAMRADRRIDPAGDARALAQSSRAGLRPCRAGAGTRNPCGRRRG